MTLRNIVLIIGLTLFLIWYVSSWAYQTQYLKPRQELGNEIAKLSGEIEGGKKNLAMMTQFRTQNVGYYYRSLPPVSNDARTQYFFWLLELLQYCGFENNDVRSGAPSRIPFGINYQFNVQCTGSLSQLSYFLFEFYYAPFLHRITSMTLTPTEGNAERLTFSMTVNALTLDVRYNPYPVTNRLPEGYIPRLAFNNLAAYQTIADRNLLQTAKGGIDRADYTVFTGIIQMGDRQEVLFSLQTDDSRIEAKLGDSIHSGSFSGRIVEILDEDIVLERGGSRWLLTVGESLKEAFALPPETGEKIGE
jgi:hypothetical protein